jgi:hypothetical protein
MELCGRFLERRTNYLFLLFTLIPSSFNLLNRSRSLSIAISIDKIAQIVQIAPQLLESLKSFTLNLQIIHSQIVSIFQIDFNHSQSSNRQNHITFGILQIVKIFQIAQIVHRCQLEFV